MQIRREPIFCLLFSLLATGCKTLSTSELSIREGLGDALGFSSLEPKTKAIACSRNFSFGLFAQTEMGSVVGNPHNAPDAKEALDNFRAKVSQQANEYFKLITAQVEEIHRVIPARHDDCTRDPKVQEIMSQKNLTLGKLFIATVVDGPSNGDTQIAVSWSDGKGTTSKRLGFSNGTLSDQVGREVYLARDINLIAEQLHNFGLRQFGITHFDHYFYALKGHSGLGSHTVPPRDIQLLLAGVNDQFSQVGIFEGVDDTGKPVAPLYFAPVWSKDDVCAARFPQLAEHYSQCLNEEYYTADQKVKGSQGPKKESQGLAKDSQGAVKHSQGGVKDSQGFSLSMTQGLGGVAEHQGAGKAAIFKLDSPEQFNSYLQSLNGAQRPIGVVTTGAGITPLGDIGEQQATRFTPPYRGEHASMFVADTCFANHPVEQKSTQPHGHGGFGGNQIPPKKVRHISMVYPGPTHMKALKYGQLTGPEYIALMLAVWQSAKIWGVHYGHPLSIRKQYADPDFVERDPSVTQLAERADILLPYILHGSGQGLNNTPQRWMNFSIGTYFCGDFGSLPDDLQRRALEYRIEPYYCFASPASSEVSLDEKVIPITEQLVERARMFDAKGDRESFSNWLRFLYAHVFWISQTYEYQPISNLMPYLNSLLNISNSGDPHLRSVADVARTTFLGDATELSETLQEKIEASKDHTFITYANEKFFAGFYHAGLHSYIIDNVDTESSELNSDELLSASLSALLTVATVGTLSKSLSQEKVKAKLFNSYCSLPGQFLHRACRSIKAENEAISEKIDQAVRNNSIKIFNRVRTNLPRLIEFNNAVFKWAHRFQLSSAEQRLLKSSSDIMTMIESAIAP